MNTAKYLLIGLAGLIILTGTGCTSEQTTTPPVDAVTNTATSVQVTGAYENSSYGFSLVFPTTWGTVKENVESGDKITSIQLTAENNPEHYISIQVVKTENKNDPAVIDYPQKPLTENATYSYYYTAYTEDYNDNDQTELKTIIQSFTLKEVPFEALSYSTIGVDVTVSKTTAPFDYTAEQLTAAAAECGTEQADGYYDELVAKFAGTTKTIYNFKYQGASQSSDTFVVTLLPNKAEYISMFGQFSKDFEVCAAGGEAYPKMLNNDWLLFTNSCGSGFDDGSGLPIGCDEVQKIVEPSLKLNTEI